MNISYDEIEIIQMIIDRLNVQSKITNIIDNSGILTLSVCSVKWGTVKDTVTINNVECTITAINYLNKTITVKPKTTVSISVNDLINFKRPQFMYGTQLSTSNEYSLKSSDSREKLPLIWAYEPSIRSRHQKPDSGIDKEVTYDLFFLDDYELDLSTNENNYRTALKPMLILRDLFIETINTMYGIFNIVESKTSDVFLRFGSEKSSKDNYYFESIIADNLSGAKLNITLPILKRYDNNCC